MDYVYPFQRKHYFHAFFRPILEGFPRILNPHHFFLLFQCTVSFLMLFYWMYLTTKQAPSYLQTLLLSFKANWEKLSDRCNLKVHLYLSFSFWNNSWWEIPLFNMLSKLLRLADHLIHKFLVLLFQDKTSYLLCFEGSFGLENDLENIWKNNYKYILWKLLHRKN